VLALEMVIQKKGIRKKKRERGAMLSFLFEILLHMLESHCWHLIKVFSVNSQNFITNTIYFLNIFITPKRNPVPISNHSPFLPNLSLVLGNLLVCCLFMDLIFWTFHK
jgi:hypothetical protein